MAGTIIVYFSSFSRKILSFTPYSAALRENKMSLIISKYLKPSLKKTAVAYGVTHGLKFVWRQSHYLIIFRRESPSQERVGTEKNASEITKYFFNIIKIDILDSR